MQTVDGSSCPGENKNNGISQNIVVSCFAVHQPARTCAFLPKLTDLAPRSQILLVCVIHKGYILVCVMKSVFVVVFSLFLFRSLP